MLDAFKIFSNAFHISGLFLLLLILITLGNLGCASSWMISPTRGMFVGCQTAANMKFLQISIWAISLLGGCSALFAILVGFLPPSETLFHSKASYSLVLLSGILLAFTLPFFIQRFPLKKRNITLSISDSNA